MNVRLVHFKQYGIAIVARLVPLAGAPPPPPAIFVPAYAAFAILTRVPDLDIHALGLGDRGNHPCNAIMHLLPVLPPVSRPSMRTMNLKTGQPFVVEDSISMEYQCILNASAVQRTSLDRNAVWQRYTEMGTGVPADPGDLGENAYGCGTHHACP